MPQNLPYNLEAEQAVLGCVIIDNSIAAELSDSMTPQDFYDRRHQLIFTAMLSIYRDQNAIDYISLVAELNSKNQLAEAGGAVYLATLIDSVYTTANISDYIAIVQDSAMKRNIIAAANSISEAGFDPNYNSTNYIDYAERLIGDLSKRRKTEGFTPISNVIDNVKEIIQKNRSTGEDITGLTSGFDNLDAFTLGLQKNNLIILAARPAMGKSAFAMNILVQAAQQNNDDKGEPINVALFSLEMPSEQIVQRMIASQAHVNLTNVQKGKLSQKESVMVNAAETDLASLNIHFCDDAILTVADIRAKCRKQKMQTGLDLVVIDYLQLISGGVGKSSNRQEEVANISRSLKQMARELEVPVIALAQLSRDVEKREDKRPQLSDLRESGSLEQDADIILFLYREDYYKKKGEEDQQNYKNSTELIIAKNRSGSTGTVNFIFQGEYQKFTKYVGN